ncbi:hypothetical protein PI124_g1730 [Phytophthora idaei]|nr:hypothetical protein PI124_g1730 [Phytophthora idaei]
MVMSSYHHSKRNGVSSSSSNNREHKHDVPYEAMNKLSVNKLHIPAPRARNNTSKEVEASRPENSKGDAETPEEPEDKVSATMTFSPHSTQGTAEKEKSRTAPCTSEDSNNSSTASSSSGAAVPTMNAVQVVSPTASPPPKVTFRKGEKSFLDFHQHYAITRHLGEGSYSTVKQVTHRKKGGFYACKIVDKLSLSDVDRAALSHELHEFIRYWRQGQQPARPAYSSSVRTQANSGWRSTSSTSDAINEKRLWWRSLRRERGAKTERTASGGFTLNLSARQTGSTPTSPITPPTAKVLRMRTPSSTLEPPETPSALSPDRLDDSIKLHDIRQLLTGDDAPFFAGHAMNLPNSSKRAVDPACVLSVCTRFRELHLEFPNEGVRDGFKYLLQQATLPLQQCAPVQPTRLMKATAVPPPPPINLSSREQGTFVATTPPDEESKMQPEERDEREHISGPEVDVETVAKEAKAVNSNQDE